MDERHDSDSTLPSLEIDFDSGEPGLELVLTILFHPDMSRIGERSVLSQSADSWVLGRHTLEFSRGSGAAIPIGDRHISRKALTISRSSDSVLLERSEDSCRCRVAGVELANARELDLADFRQGVPILLAHNVVLLLSLSPSTGEGAALPDYRLLGSSAATIDLRRQIHRIASSDLDVLLRGETGTGKEVVASAIHRASARCGVPMVSVNVAAIPGSLAPAALFGAARGAFTGADRARLGYFQQAEGGILFLDEIGDAPEEVQPQLLRALQQREIQPVGGDIQQVNVRVISATDAQLEGDGASFKSALRHRLGALEICLPPLREHREDVGEILQHYLGEALDNFGRGDLMPGGTPREIACCATLFYQAACFHWPGNVRQLLNVCSQVAVASENRLRVPSSVSALFDLAAQGSEEGAIDGEPVSTSYRSIQEILDEDFDRAMHESYYEVAGAAQRLGVSRQSVYRRMASSGVYRKASDLPEPELLDAVRECDGDTLAAAQLLRVSASGLRSRLRVGTHADVNRP